MIEYQKGFLGLPSFLHWYGSVVPRSLVPAVVSAIATIVIKLTDLVKENETNQKGPAYGPAMTAINYIVGFLLVYRAQQSYARCAVCCGCLRYFGDVISENIPDPSPRSLSGTGKVEFRSSV